MVLLMIIVMTGCSGASTEKQEQAVKDFFTHFQSADLEKMASVCTSDNTDVKQLTRTFDQLKVYQNVSIYGQTFVDEANGFINEMFAQMIPAYKIEEVEKEGKDYKVSVKVQMRDYNSINFNSSEMTSLAKEYQTAHLSELKEIYKTQGQQAMMEKIYGDLAKDMVKIMKDKIDESKAEEKQLIFTLTADGDNWLISKIDVKSSIETKK